MEKFPIDIYGDGFSLQEMATLSVQGYTFNPTLFRSLGVTNYLEHCKLVVGMSKGKPVSLEVIADTNNEMIRQAKILSALGKNVYVKIPITRCDGKYPYSVLAELVDEGININITAVFYELQVKEILPIIKGTSSIISIFAGRLFDIGRNAMVDVFNMAETIHTDSDCKVLWASPRQVYDIVNAVDARCDIITMSPSLIKKLPLFDKTPKEYSLSTVKMFFEDAKNAQYEF